jgi:hypothetical protein
LKTQRDKLKQMIHVLMKLDKTDVTIKDKETELDKTDTLLSALENIKELLQKPNMSQQASEFMKGLKDLETHISSQMSQTTQRLDELKTEQLKHNKLEERITDLEKQKQELKSRIDNVTKLEEEIARLKSLQPTSDIAAQLSTMTSLLEKLKKDLDKKPIETILTEQKHDDSDLQRKLKEVSDLNKKLVDENVKLSDTLTSLQKQLQSSSSGTELQNIAHAAELAKAEHEKQTKEHTDSINLLTEQIRQQKDKDLEISTLTDAVSAEHKRYLEYVATSDKTKKEELDHLVKRNEDAMNALKESIKKEKDALQQKINESEKIIEDLIKQNTRILSEKVDLTQVDTSASGELQKVKTNLEETRLKISELEKNIKQKEEQIHTLTEKANTSDTLHSNLTDTLQKLESITKQKDDLEKQISVSTITESSNLKIQLAEKEAEIAILKKDVDAKTQELSKTVADLTLIKTQLEDKTKEHDLKIQKIEKEIETKKHDLATTKNIVTQTVSMLTDLSGSLNGTPYTKLAETLRDNIQSITLANTSMSPLTLKPVVVDTILPESSSLTGKDTIISPTVTTLGNAGDIKLDAVLSELKPQDITKRYDEYKTILNELIDLEGAYFKMATSFAEMPADMKDLAQKALIKSEYTVHTEDTSNVYADKKDTFLIYSFMATALFQLTRTFIRLPTVLRILSVENDRGTNRDAIMKATKLDVSNFLINNKYLQSNLSDLYTRFNTTKDETQGIMRIDSVAYYLLSFINKTSTLELTSSDANTLFASFEMAFKVIIKQITSVYKSIQDSNVSALDAVMSTENTIIRNQHANSNPVVTFVKLRMDGGVHVNRRFRCHPLTETENEEERHMMHMEYCDFDYRFGPDERPFGNSEFMANGFPFYYSYKKDKTSPAEVYETCDGFGTVDRTSQSIIPYNSDMYFGPFTRIYAPHMSNSDITNDSTFRESIEKKLRENKPACIIGYGASGSGKTSTIVYFRPEQGVGQDGILTILSNNLSDTYDTIHIKVYEFEGNVNSEKPISDYIIRKYPPEPISVDVSTKIKGREEKIEVYMNETISFIERNMTDDARRTKLDPTNPTESSFVYTYDKNWVKSNTGKLFARKLENQTQSAYDALSSTKMFKDGVYYEIIPEPLTESDGSPMLMATDIVNFMDNKRSVAATANNPVSSRSHVIIFITYSSRKNQAIKPTTLVLCDFAGVENKFDCQSASTLSKLGSIPIKGDPNDTPFYETRTNGLKIKKYKEYLDGGVQNKARILESVSWNGVLQKNVKWMLDEIINQPLSVKDQKNAPGISGEIAEKMYQELYPGAPMDPLDFVNKIKMIYEVKNVLLTELESYRGVLGEFPNARIRLNNSKFNAYSETITLLDKLIKSLSNLDNSRLLTVKNENVIKKDIPKHGQFTCIPEDAKNNVANFESTVRKILKSLKLKIKDVSMLSNGNPVLMHFPDTEGESVKDFLNAFIILAPSFGAELFTDYDTAIDLATTAETKAFALLEKRRKLQVMQYIFEYGILGVNTIADATPTFMENICKDRVKEGLFINDSLLQLRKFISQLVRGTSKGYPAFSDQCAPIQCNPSYKNCFGINNYDSKDSKTPLNSSLAKQILKVENSENMTFCILCVVNLSRTSANNPPVSPYINITSLTSEYERLQLVQSQYFMDKESMREAIGSVLNGQILSNSFKVNPTVLDNLKNHRLLTRPLDPDVIRMVKSTCDDLLESPGMTEAGYLDRIKTLIDVIYNINAITTIGTLEFTDTMAKFGTNSVTCTMSYTPITDAQVDAFLKSMNGYMSDTVFNGLKALEKRGKIAMREDMTDSAGVTIPSIMKQLTPFKNGITQELPPRIEVINKTVEKKDMTDISVTSVTSVTPIMNPLTQKIQTLSSKKVKENTTKQILPGYPTLTNTKNKSSTEISNLIKDYMLKTGLDRAKIGAMTEFFVDQGDVKAPMYKSTGVDWKIVVK